MSYQWRLVERHPAIETLRLSMLTRLSSMCNPSDKPKGSDAPVSQPVRRADARGVWACARVDMGGMQMKCRVYRHGIYNPSLRLSFK